MKAQDTHPPRYFAVRQGELIVVDTSAHGELSIDQVVILDLACAEIRVLHSDFTEGALITLEPLERPTIVKGRKLAEGGDTRDFQKGEASCEAAINQLQASPSN